MLYSRNYSRLFITMKQESNRFCVENRPAAGRCIIEIRNNEGKIMLFVQGLKPRVLYRMALVKKEDNGAAGVNAGLVGIDERGKGETTFAFKPDDVLGSGLKIEDFEAVVIIAEGIGELEAPLAGYRTNSFDWKKNFKIIRDNIRESEENIKEEASKEALADKKISEEKAENEAYLNDEKANNDDTLAIKETKEEQEIQEKQEKENDSFQTSEEDADSVESQGAVNRGIDFNVFLERFKKNMLELEKYAKMTEAEKPRSRGRGIQGTDYIKKYNKRIKPFEKNDDNIDWYRIMPCELTMVNAKLWRHLNNPFINSCFRKYRHLILGIKNQDGRESFIVGVPEKYDSSYTREAEEQGFDRFMCRDCNELEEGAMGYWLMDVD